MLLTRDELRALGPSARTSSATGLGNLGIVPVIAAAAGEAAGGYFAADAAKAQAKAEAEMYEAQAIALAAPARYAFKTAKQQIRADRFSTAVDAVSGQTVRVTKDYSGLMIGGAIAGALLFGFLIIKAV
jgi:hypothetical protein